MALKETVLAFSFWNRCALIGRIYLSLIWAGCTVSNKPPQALTIPGLSARPVVPNLPHAATLSYS